MQIFIRHGYISARIALDRSVDENRDAWAPIEFYQCMFVTTDNISGEDVLANHSTWSLNRIDISEELLAFPTIPFEINAYIPGPEFPEFVGCYAGNGDPSMNDFRLGSVGAVIRLNDAAVPVSIAQSVSFVDVDGRGGVLGGSVDFISPEVLPELIETYNISFGSASQSFISNIGIVQSVATNLGDSPLGGNYRFACQNIFVLLAEFLLSPCFQCCCIYVPDFHSKS